MHDDGTAPLPRSEVGASSVEYALIVFAVAATIVAALFALGPPVYRLFDGTCQAVKGGVENAGGPTSCT